MFSWLPFIRHLEHEVAWYRTQLIHERQRAEAAIDELLRVRVQVNPVSQPITQPMLSDMEKMWQNPEFTEAGA